MKSGRNDADNSDVLAVQREVLAKNIGGRTKLSLPKTCADQRNWRSPNLILSGREQTTHEWLDTQNRKQIRRDELAAHLHRFSAASQAKGGAPVNCHCGERTILLLPISKVEVGNRSVFEVRLTLAQSHEPLWFGIRQTTKKDSIHNREQRSIRTNSQRQGDHCNCGKSWIVTE